MSFKLKAGKVKVVPMPVTTSTALAAGSLVTFTTGLLVAATSTTPAVDVAGVLVKAIAATDSDYADTRLVGVQVPMEKNCLWEFDVTSGLVAADIGLDCDLTDASTVNRAASTYDIVRPLRVISATKGQGLLKISGAF